MDCNSGYVLSAALMSILICTCNAQTICSLENRESADGLATCLQAIRDAMVNESAFWFGTEYPQKCPVPDDTMECLNLEPTLTSMADRLFFAGTFDPSKIANYLDITTYEKPGSYAGCGHTYTTEVEADHPLDPIDPTPLTPWQAAHGFSASVQGLDTSSQYTLIFQDVGYFFLHGVYINIPGNGLDIEAGEAIFSYRGPLYFKKDPLTPYTFLLLRQTEANMELTSFWQDYFSGSASGRFNISEFVNDQKLEGPVAVNWLMSLTDPYAAEILFRGSIVNICPMFVEEAERKLDLYHVPNDVPFTASVNIEYYSIGMNFSTCCNDYSFENATYVMDPIGDSVVTPFDNKDPPVKIDFFKMKFTPLPIDFEGELHTLLMIDPDVTNPDVGTKEKPIAHWLVTNIQNGMIEEGETMISYRGSMPPAGQTHRYQFLLYQQQGLLDIDPRDYNPGCQANDRCLFEVERFVDENQLSFLGASWYVATSDDYVAYLKQQQGEQASEVCALIPGYEDPCPSAAASMSDFLGNIIISYLTLMLFVFITVI